MHTYFHILTDIERVVDPDGQQFDSLAAATAEARQCARDLMAEELRQGRPLPLSWRVQIADHEGAIEATLSFREIALGQMVPWARTEGLSVLDPDLVHRAKAIFFKAGTAQAALNDGLRMLSENVRVLSKLTGEIPRVQS